jgi:NAD(P)-dependent dehydrogenase (short-subunit alcohol dehydrogenase family)
VYLRDSVYTRSMTTLSLHDLLSLTGKTALITGAAQGIGLAIARRYAEAGANLQIIDVNEAAVAVAKQELEATYDVTVQTYVVNLADSQAIVEFWQQLSPLPDILVNNAGIFWPKKLPEIDDASYERIMNINVRSVVLMCREMITRSAHPGTIVNIGSIEGLKGMTYDMLLYGTSKSAVLGITRGIVKDYGKKGWKVNTLLPGGISTPGARAMGVAALKKLDFSIVKTGITFNLRLPAARMGQPDDIARAALWLGTPLSDYMNGAEVVVDGGFLAV